MLLIARRFSASHQRLKWSKRLNYIYKIELNILFLLLSMNNIIHIYWYRVHISCVCVCVFFTAQYLGSWKAASWDESWSRSSGAEALKLKCIERFYAIGVPNAFAVKIFLLCLCWMRYHRVVNNLFFIALSNWRNMHAYTYTITGKDIKEK